jgi:cadmium resistance protein CadD (predicted permease)
MKLITLLPNRFKKVGWVILSLSLFLWIIHIFFEWEPKWLTVNYFTILDSQIFASIIWFKFIKQDMLYTLLTVLPIIGGLLVGFSREKEEDEFIEKLRLSSLLWAVLINYVLLLLVSLSVFGLAFMNVLTVHMFSVLLIFIVRFNYLLWKNRKEMTNEE